MAPGDARPGSPPRRRRRDAQGGALADVAEHGLRYELAEVRRFSAEWERSASLRLRDGDATVLDEYAKHGRLRDGGTAEQAEAAAARAWLADTLSGRESLLMVRDNSTAARVSAHLRAELVDLGKVEEAGVTLGMDGWEGVTAGVGDLVQARRNAWHLAGYEGNERAPINRDTFRVVAVRADGGLTVAPITGRTDDDTPRLSRSAPSARRWGRRCSCPPGTSPSTSPWPTPRQRTPPRDAPSTPRTEYSAPVPTPPACSFR
ncbi:MAG: AAA family ATPase [Pseudonocardia sp.]